MSNEQIRLLESIRDGVQLLGTQLGGQISETNVRLASIETSFGARLGKVEGRLGNVDTGLGKVECRLGNVDTGLGKVECRLGNVDTGLGKIERRLGNVERQLEVTNNHLYTLVKMHSESSVTLSVRADQSDKRINALEQRVDKLEQTG